MKGIDSLITLGSFLYFSYKPPPLKLQVLNFISKEKATIMAAQSSLLNFQTELELFIQYVVS
jgi:hypothetical protein